MSRNCRTVLLCSRATLIDSARAFASAQRIHGSHVDFVPRGLVIDR